MSINYMRSGILTLILIGLCLNANAKKLVIQSQEDFDKINIEILDAIESGASNVRVCFAPGQYVYKQNHINLNKIKNNRLTISIEGNGARLIPEGYAYNNGDDYVGNYRIQSSWMSGNKDINTWSRSRYADGLVEVVDPNTKKCRIKVKEILPSTSGRQLYVKIPHWFRSSVYEIEEIKGNYIYFKAPDLSISSKGDCNINGDFTHGGKEVRYKLCNLNNTDDCIKIVSGKVVLPQGIANVYEGIVTSFLTLNDCRFKRIKISGLIFLGACSDDEKSLVNLCDNNASSIKIEKCKFVGIRSNVLSIINSNNVTINKCSFEYCWYNGVVADNGSGNFTIENSMFNMMGLGMSNTFSIQCCGDNYHVCNNVLTDFGYGGIAVGLYYENRQSKPIKGVVENNELYYSDEYISHIADYGIMDGGAIYVFTKNDETTIKGNYIDGYTGIDSNRGIFCDDGAYNVHIHGNIILNISNSYCIDSRRVPEVENTYSSVSGIANSNVNITISDNVVDGAIRFVGKSGIDNNCTYGNNYSIRPTNSPAIANTVNHVSKVGDEISFDASVSNGKVSLQKSDYKTLKHSRNWKVIRKRVVKK